MPIYEYECSQCGEIFEKLIIGGSKSTDVNCANCGSNQVRRLMSKFSASGSGVGEGSSCSPNPGGFT